MKVIEVSPVEIRGGRNGVPASGWAWLSRTRRQSCVSLRIQKGSLGKGIVIGTDIWMIEGAKKERRCSF